MTENLSLFRACDQCCWVGAEFHEGALMSLKEDSASEKETLGGLHLSPPEQAFEHSRYSELIELNYTLEII